MYAKYRLYLIASNGSYVMGASNTVNDLVDQSRYWLTRSIGARLGDDQVRQVVLYVLDKKTGSYLFDSRLPVTDRKDILTKVRLLGGR